MILPGSLHPYTCGLCQWGRYPENHDYDAYLAHMRDTHGLDRRSNERRGGDRRAALIADRSWTDAGDRPLVMIPGPTPPSRSWTSWTSGDLVALAAAVIVILILLAVANR